MSKELGKKISQRVLSNALNDNATDYDMLMKLCEMILNTESETGVKYPVEFYQGIALEFYKWQSDETRAEKLFKAL